MSGKIDQGLDDIIKANGRGQRRSRRVTRKTTAPAGGIKKNTKTTTTKTTTVKSKPAAIASASVPTKTGPSKIIVSNLPTDVTEAQIKDYFVQTIGPVKKVFLTYGPNGQSRGVATIIFSTPQAASESAKLLNGTKVDGKPMRVEVVLGADQAPPQVAKALAERISQAKQQTKQPAKNQPKSAATKKVTATSTKPKKTTTRGRNSNRPKRKTADELDAEMNDYWDTGATNGANAGGAVQPVANGGDAAMEEDVL